MYKVTQLELEAHYLGEHIDKQIMTQGNKKKSSLHY